MDIKTVIFLLATLTFSACIDISTDEIKGYAYIVDNFKDKNPLEGLYIEVEYTKDEGYTYELLTSSFTDKNGFFEIDEKYKTDFLGLDCWAIANVYSDSNYSDTLGSFGFQFPDDTYDYKTIELGTLKIS